MSKSLSCRDRSAIDSGAPGHSRPQQAMTPIIAFLCWFAVFVTMLRAIDDMERFGNFLWSLLS